MSAGCRLVLELELTSGMIHRPREPETADALCVYRAYAELFLLVINGIWPYNAPRFYVHPPATL